MQGDRLLWLSWCISPLHPEALASVSAPVPKKLRRLASTDDCYSLAKGCTDTLGNIAKATFDAISKTYNYLT
jgi:small subunit ribosomal protein S2e